MESKSLPQEKLADLETSRYIANVSLLTILRTWCGIFIFSGDMNGLNSYLNILATHGEEEPELAKQMLCVLFTLIGVAPPSYLQELAHHHTSSVYWNGCSLFILDFVPGAGAAEGKSILFYLPQTCYDEGG